MASILAPSTVTKESTSQLMQSAPHSQPYPLLLAAKFARPRLPAGLVTRERLLRDLDRDELAWQNDAETIPDQWLPELRHNQVPR